MVTAKADDKQRVRIPDIKPGQIFAILDNGDGSLTLTPIKPAPKQRPFDPHLYDDLDADRLQLEQKLSAASAKVDVSREERDRK